MAAVVSDLLGEGLEEQREEVSGEVCVSRCGRQRRRLYLGDGAAEALAEVTPLPPSALMVPAADITVDIMALMEDRSPFCRLSSGTPASTDAPFTSAVMATKLMCH